MSHSLIKKYEELLIEHQKLKHEFTENVIIQSMQDMKQVNEILSNKLEKINEIVDKVFDYNLSVKIMLETLSRNTDNSKYITKCRIEFIEEIVNSSIKLKSDVIFINYI